MNIDEKIKQLEEADLARTQGEWQLDDESFVVSQDQTICQFFSKSEEYFKNVRRNAEFIALCANEMPKLLKAFKKMRDGLEKIEKHEIVICSPIARQTLAEVEEILK